MVGWLGAGGKRPPGPIEHINLSEVARNSGVSVSYLSRLFSGNRTNPGLEIAQRIARAMGISLDKFADMITNPGGKEDTGSDSSESKTESPSGG